MNLSVEGFRIGGVVAGSESMPIQLGVFPMSSDFYQNLYHFYDLNKPIAFGLLSTVFTIRALMLVVSGSGAREYGELFRDLLFTAIALVGFTSFLQLISNIPDFLIHQFSEYNVAEPKAVETGFTFSFINGLMSLTDIIAIVITVLVAIVYSILVGIACILGPFIVLFSIMGRQWWIMKTIVTCLVITALWPVLWYLLNLFMHQMMDNETFLKSSFVFIVGTLAKFGVPIAMIKSMGHISGASSAASGAKNVVDGTTGGTAQVARMAASATTYMGGGHYVESLKSGISTMGNFTKNASSKAAGQMIPTMEKIGLGTANAIGKGVSKITPPQIKTPTTQAFEKTKQLTSNISKSLKGHNYEAFSLGSPTPNQAGSKTTAHTTSGSPTSSTSWQQSRPGYSKPDGKKASSQGMKSTVAANASSVGRHKDFKTPNYKQKQTSADVPAQTPIGEVKT